MHQPPPSDPIPLPAGVTPAQAALNAARKQVTGKSSMVILREQTAAILTIATNIHNAMGRLVTLMEGVGDIAGHLADQAMIQRQSAELVNLRAELVNLHNDAYVCAICAAPYGQLHHPACTGRQP